MRKFLFPLCVLLSLTVNSQTTDKFEKVQKSIAKQAAEADSIKKVNDSLLIKRIDSMNMVTFKEQNSRNLDAFVRTIKEREQKQKQQMWMRLGFGVLMLAVLIFGLFRKRKRKSVNNY